MAGSKAAAKEILAEKGFQVTVDGRVVPVQQVDPSQLWNFYHVAGLMAVFAAYRVRSEMALDALFGTERAGADEDLYSAIGRCSKVANPEMFQRVRMAAETLVATYKDAETQAICKEILACYDQAWAFHGVAIRGIGFLTQRVVAAFDDLQARSKALFGELRPVLQELMGRPNDAQIDAAIDTVESAQSRLDEYIEDFRVYVVGLTAAEEKIPDPTQPLNSPENEHRLKHVRNQLATMIRDDDATLDALLEAVNRAGGMLLTVVTAIRQIDQRLEMFGVTTAP